MTTAALIFAVPVPPLASAALVVGGIDLVARQVRAAAAAGASPIVVVGDGAAGKFAPRGRVAPDGVLCAATPAAAAPLLAGATDVIVFDPGVVVAAGLVAAVVAGPAPAVATGAGGGERLDATTTAAGVGCYPAAMVVATIAGLGDWDLALTLRRTAWFAGAVRVPAGAAIAAVPGDADAAARVTAALLAAARVTVFDAPSRWLAVPLRDRLITALLPTTVPAVAVLGAKLGLVALATLAVARGLTGVGAALALAFCALPGAATLVARVRLDAVGPLAREAAIDRFAEVAWLGAAAVAGLAWPLVALVVGFAVADGRQEAAFARLTGAPLATAGGAEATLRLLGAAPATRLCLWLPFVLAGAATTGLVVVAGYTAATFFAAQSRVFTRLGARLTAR